MKKFFILFLIFQPAVVYCQTTTWSSSHPTIVSVDANGVAKLETTNTSGIQFVTITTATIQNGKTTTSTKQVEVNPYYPGCNSPSVYIAGFWVAGCRIGATDNTQKGTIYKNSSPACAVGWRLPVYGTDNNLIMAIINCNSMYYDRDCGSNEGLQGASNYHIYRAKCSGAGLDGGTSGACGYPAVCIKN